MNMDMETDELLRSLRVGGFRLLAPYLKKHIHFQAILNQYVQLLCEKKAAFGHPNAALVFGFQQGHLGTMLIA
jgi:hypothetical protein